MPLAPLSVLPRSVMTILKEAARHVLRRPVVGVAVAAHTQDGRWLLIRRSDTGEWALPGGTLEWGETLATCLARELLEEAGTTSSTFERVVGVYSHPDRDPRFHAVTVVVRAEVEAPTRAPVNPLEILEARLFRDDELPPRLSHATTDMLAHARAADLPTVFE
jgi:8-oxo-dGTP diphosphatase